MYDTNSAKQYPVYPQGSFKAKVVNLVPPSVTPNHITFFRLAATAGIVVVQIIGWPLWLMFLLGFVAGMSDLLDGMVARQRQQITPLGAFLDPLGDKALAIAVAAVVMLRGMISWQALVCILVVEAHALFIPLLHILRQSFRQEPVWPPPKIRPNKLGKYKTFGLISSLGLIVLGAVIRVDVLILVGQWLVWVAVIMGAGASARYYWDWLHGRFD